MPPRYYTGPISDHFDGVRFFDPHGVPVRSRRDLLRWLADRRWRGTRAKWPIWAPSPYADRPPARVEGSTWRISYVGHASFLIQTAGLNILLDPVWSKRASPSRFIGPKRVNDPGIAVTTRQDWRQANHARLWHRHARIRGVGKPERRCLRSAGNGIVLRRRD